MGEESKLSKLYFRKRENWFKELLYKIKILKPKYIIHILIKIKCILIFLF